MTFMITSWLARLAEPAEFISSMMIRKVCRAICGHPRRNCSRGQQCGPGIEVIKRFFNPFTEGDQTGTQDGRADGDCGSAFFYVAQVDAFFVNYQRFATPKDRVVESAASVS
jgi:hypothetical protein